MTNKSDALNERSGLKGGKIFSAFSSVIGTIVVVLIILLCIPVTIPGFMGYGIYNVVSGSMEPAIPVGSVVYTDSVAPEEIQVGDVIAYSLNGMLITHRVMEIDSTESTLITKGDANPDVDMEPVRFSQVIGKVSLSIPMLGAFFEFFTSIKGKIILMITLVAAFGLLMLSSNMKEKIKKQEKKPEEEEKKAKEDKEDKEDKEE